MINVDETKAAPVNAISIFDVGDGDFMCIVNKKGEPISTHSRIMISGIDALNDYLKMFFASNVVTAEVAEASPIPATVEKGTIGFTASKLAA